MTQQTIQDQSGDKKYFIITPQLVLAKSRDPFDYTLWCVVKMVAGDDGECFLSTRDLADLAMMSAGKVTDSRQYLLSCRLLEGELTRDPGQMNEVWHLKIPDLWAENIKWRQENDSLKKRIKAKKEQRQNLKDRRKLEKQAKKARSSDEQPPTPDEQPPTPDEPKKNPTDNQQGKPLGANAPEKQDKPIKDKKPKSDRPPAVDTYREIANRFPDKATWPLLEHIDNLEFWENVVRSYIACGWSKVNLKGMIGFYDRKEIPIVKQNGATNGQSNKRTNQNGKSKSTRYSPKTWTERRAEAAGRH